MFGRAFRDVYPTLDCIDVEKKNLGTEKLVQIAQNQVQILSIEFCGFLAADFLLPVPQEAGLVPRCRCAAIGTF